MIRYLSFLMALLGGLALSCAPEPVEPEFSAREWVEAQRRAEPQYNGPDVRLEARFAPGSYTLNQSAVIRGQFESTRTGEIDSAEIRQRVTGDLEISEPDEQGVQTVRYTCRRVRETNATARGVVTYDTDGPELDEDSPPMAAVLKSLNDPFVGWTATLRVRNGEVIETEGLDDQLHQVDELAEGEGPDEALAAVRRQRQLFLGGMLTQNWARLLPDRAVGPGDTWEQDIQVAAIPFLGDTQFETACLLEDIELSDDDGPGIAVVRFAIAAVARDHQIDLTAISSAPLRGTAGDILLQSKGTIRFDLDSGFPRETTVDMLVAGDMYLRGPQGNERLVIEEEREVTTTLEPK